MKPSFKSITTAAMLLVTILVFTSCEGVFDDLFGEWSRPTGNVNSGNEKPSGNISVTSIMLDETSLTKNRGDAAVTLTATVKPDNATDKTITWTSENPAVASVNNGLVSIIGVGTAIITAAANDGSGVKATCTVTVSVPGLLAGKFTINASGDQVRFSQGNLQATYNGSSWIWAFAEHQWDYIGNGGDATVGNEMVTTTDPYISGPGTVDLFGWVGASSIWTGAAQYGITSSTIASYGNSNTESLKSDWGTLTITNGGNTANSGWYTLSDAEWTYLCNTRSGGNVNNFANARYTLATINTDGTPVKGLIIFPDGVTIANSEATSWGKINDKTDGDNWANSTHCNTTEWTALAAKGCVFLPAVGSRSGTTVSFPGTRGFYWSSVTIYASTAKYLAFNEGLLATQNDADRGLGFSVRLVYDVK